MTKIHNGVRMIRSSNLDKLENRINSTISEMERKYDNFEVVNITYRESVSKHYDYRSGFWSPDDETLYSSVCIHYKYTEYIEGED